MCRQQGRALNINQAGQGRAAQGSAAWRSGYRCRHQCPLQPPLPPPARPPARPPAHRLLVHVVRVRQHLDQDQGVGAAMVVDDINVCVQAKHFLRAGRAEGRGLARGVASAACAGPRAVRPDASSRAVGQFSTAAHLAACTCNACLEGGSKGLLVQLVGVLAHAAEREGSRGRAACSGVPRKGGEELHRTGGMPRMHTGTLRLQMNLSAAQQAATRRTYGSRSRRRLQRGGAGARRRRSSPHLRLL